MMLYGEGEQEEQRKMVSCDEKLERGTKGEMDEGIIIIKILPLIIIVKILL